MFQLFECDWNALQQVVNLMRGRKRPGEWTIHLGVVPYQVRPRGISGLIPTLTVWSPTGRREICIPASHEDAIQSNADMNYDRPVIVITGEYSSLIGRITEVVDAVRPLEDRILIRQEENSAETMMMPVATSTRVRLNASTLPTASRPENGD